MKNSKSYLVAAFAVACSVLLMIVLWAVYGVLLPDEGGHAHSAGEMIMADEFEARTTEFIEEHQLSDGSVRASHDEPVYIISSQYTFTPNVLRLEAGADYELRIFSPDVVHAFSVQMGGTSYNSVIMPMSIMKLNVKPTVPGTYLTICNEYCGLGHDFMYFTIIVEESAGAHDDGDGDGDGHANDEQADGDEHGEEDEHADGDEHQ
ncbi:MAG: hypothetical protein V3R96_00610 [Dehalococcoidales bacterium]